MDHYLQNIQDNIRVSNKKKYNLLILTVLKDIKSFKINFELIKMILLPQGTKSYIKFSLINFR